MYHGYGQEITYLCLHSEYEDPHAPFRNLYRERYKGFYHAPSVFFPNKDYVGAYSSDPAANLWVLYSKPHFRPVLLKQVATLIFSGITLGARSLWRHIELLAMAHFLQMSRLRHPCLAIIRVGNLRSLRY